MLFKVTPEATELARAAIYKARWVDAFGKNAVVTTDAELASVAAAAVYWRAVLDVFEYFGVTPETYGQLGGDQ